MRRIRFGVRRPFREARLRIKIGWCRSARGVRRRIRELQTGCDEELLLIGIVYSIAEDDVHQRFRHVRTRGVWFLREFIAEHGWILETECALRAAQSKTRFALSVL